MALGPVRVPGIIRFGTDFEFDVRSYELRRGGSVRKLERIPMEVLLLLLEHAGQLVTRDQIVERIWGKEVFLDTDNSINSAIRKIRLVLSDDPDEPRFIQTIVGRGYLFKASEVEIGPEAGSLPPKAELTTDSALIGRRIGEYRILQLLGAGGMGVVYKAEDLKLGRQVAIKFLPPELSNHPGALERVQREARLTSALEHPNIGSIYQLAEHDGRPFIVMQFLEGETLREWIAAESRPPAATCARTIVRIAVQIASGLEAAHAKGVVHRDIKPANIFLTVRGETKILDFGVATLCGASAPAERSADMAGPGDSRPHLNTVPDAGTPSYLSPEQVRLETVDPRTDLFSFGSVLYEMCTGHRAFAGNSTAEIQDAVLHRQAIPMRTSKPDLPPELERIVARALEKDRERRYPSAAAMRADLEQLGRQLEQPPQPAIAAAHKPTRLTPARIAIAFATVAAVGVVFLWLYAREARQPYRNFTITQITTSGKAEHAAISPDGKFILHVQNENGVRSLRLRNIATGSDTEIFAPAATGFRSLGFSPDGNYVYFRQLVNSIGSEWDAFRMPVLGGKPQLVARDVDGDILFSPDARSIAYVRANDPEEGKYRVLTANPDGTGETVLTIQRIAGFGNDAYPPFAAWSPDARQIAFSFARMADEPGIVRVLDVPKKTFGVLQHFPNLQTFEIRWLPRHDWLLLIDSPTRNDSGNAQISAFSLRDRQLHPITRDTSSYSDLSLSADGRSMAAVQTRTDSFVELFPFQVQALASPTAFALHNVSSLDWSDNGRLLFSDGTKLSRADVADGKQSEVGLEPAGNIVGLAQCAGGPILINWEYRSGTEGSSIWRSNPDGSNPLPLSDGKYDMAPSCSPDGQWAYYLDGMQELKRVPVGGGKPQALALKVDHLDRILGPVSFSPDGRTAVALLDIVDPDSNHAEPRLALFDVDHPEGTPRLVVPSSLVDTGSLHGGGARFTPDGKSLVYPVRERGVGNLWIQPLDGSPGHALTNFTSDQVAQFRFSPDGKTIAIKRSRHTADIAVLRESEN